MKRIRSIQFKVFICLFISFMVVFGYIVKTKYDQSFNELLYYSQSSTSDDYINYCTAISNKNGEYREFDLDKIKQGLSELPKDDSTKIYLLDTYGNPIEQYGYEKDDHLLIVHDPFVEINESDVDTDYSDDFYDARYYIDLSSLSSEQYQLLIETIKDVEKNEYDDIHLYFEGQIEELKNFKDTSQSTYNTKNRYYKVKPTFIHYNTDIFGQKKGNTVEAFYEAYVENGEVHLKKNEEEAYGDTRVSTSKINELSKKAVNEHFSNVYAGLASFLDDVSIDSNSQTAIKKTNEIATSLKKGTLTYASFTKILDNYSYSVLLLPLDEHHGYVEGQEPAPNALIAVFYDFQSGGRNQLRNDLFKDNFPLLLGGFLFIVLFSYLISYMTTRRIKEIDRIAMEITNNNFEGVLDTKGHDELSSLSSHINTMSSNLKRNIDALNLEIDQVKKMEQLRKEFIAQFTHEIKTPLAIINGNIDLLENVDDEDKKAKYIEVINKEISVINDLVLQMLDLSKLEAKAITLDKKEIDLRELSEDIIDDYEQLLMDKKLKIEIQGEDVLIVGDRKRIEMVIQNYLSNAIKHAFINSTIKIKIKENEFSIENKGKQIDENRMDSIWESFVSDDQKGTGLGLAIVRNILELHEMSYGVYNLQGGVEFYFRWKK
ncbi:sensor histidine kinase [Faecalibacillus intestinalis]|uniref:histidine kinase n=1 Tax=Faecalibacillus intestinalis TaxID=1982626 RepID=A0AAW4VG08_9FIRM|nr:HAMP domain-containing sensor histidine kinase [Faecalibacillus intestinalis]RGG31230.1 sensor histidine kinase [Coprobacillus sp. AF24-1LB]RHO35130.1 sensor histidine kinase [Coprobacillus sp. AM17-34]MCB8562392.1 HAMP domain-containing histidine kinase [Faecalibacillus intestinalis]MCG4810505.1 HAMP domain-containing histidine kinase [Faecalibacillus intestinalis]MEE1446980.1 HAMP domain-containing sensor histidine kinase [Faecalibacillus intestinalis]